MAAVRSLAVALPTRARARARRAALPRSSAAGSSAGRRGATLSWSSPNERQASAMTAIELAAPPGRAAHRTDRRPPGAAASTAPRDPGPAGRLSAGNARVPAAPPRHRSAGREPFSVTAAVRRRPHGRLARRADASRPESPAASRRGRSYPRRRLRRCGHQRRGDHGLFSSAPPPRRRPPEAPAGQSPAPRT